MIAQLEELLSGDLKATGLILGHIINSTYFSFENQVTKSITLLTFVGYCKFLKILTCYQIFM